MHAPRPQPLGQAAAVVAQSDEDDVHRRVHRASRAGGVAGGFAIRILALEDSQHRRKELVQRLRVKNHVRGSENRDDAHQCDQAHRLPRDVPQRNAERPDDQRELADLGHRQTGQEARAAPIAHRAHDDQDDQGIAEEHEQRQPQRGPELGPHGRPVQAGTEVDEEEQQQEVPQAHQLGADRIAELGRRQGDAGQKRADLLAESQTFTGGSDQHRPGNREEHEHLLRLGELCQQPRQNVSHEQADADQKTRPLEGHEQRRRHGRLATRQARAEGRQGYEGQDGRDVLHDQEPHGDAPVQRVDLPLVRQELDDDDRAGERQRHRNVDRADHGQPQGQRDDEPDDGSEDDLAQTGGQGHRAGGADQVQVQPQPDDEQQQGDPDGRQQLDLLVVANHAQTGRARQDPGCQEHDDQGLAQTLAEDAKHCRQT